MQQKRKFFLITQRNLSAETPAFCVHGLRLLLIEDRKTHTCHPSYYTIATATGMSKNTVLKNINVLLEAGLITVEPSNYFDKRGMKWKGNNLYTILPVHSAVGIFHQWQLRRLELNVAKSRLAAQATV